jgi:hypothetical protein
MGDFAESAATRLILREGVSAIWRLHVMAAQIHGEGNERMALSVLEIADAAERQWNVLATNAAGTTQPGKPKAT